MVVRIGLGLNRREMHAGCPHEPGAASRPSSVVLGPATLSVDRCGVAPSVTAMSRSCPRRPAVARSRSQYGRAVAALHSTPQRDR